MQLSLPHLEGRVDPRSHLAIFHYCLCVADYPFSGLESSWPLPSQLHGISFYLNKDNEFMDYAKLA